MTAHDYKLICPNYQMYVARKREICGRCVPGRYYRCVARRCFRDSFSASALAAGAMYIHRAMGIYEKSVSAILHATEFLRAKLVEGGVTASSLVHVPLYIDRSRFDATAASGDASPATIVYAGRLSPEKGLHTLLRAMRELPQVRLAILGDGPERPALEAQARDAANVDFCGFLDGNAYARKLAAAQLLVLPSESYETCGLVAWEAHALGVPVVASRIGGIPESVIDAETGLLFTPGDPADLVAKVRRMLDRPDEARAMGARGRERVSAHCDAHYDRIRAVYERAISRGAA
jgi:glycosyltransferase involved in cell wall biosynthesis